MIQARGFTLVEVLLSVSIIALLAGLSTPVYLAYSNRNDITLAANCVVNALRRAQTYSRGIADDSQWGVAVQSGAITLFKGSAYATRDTAYDESTPLPSTITPSGLTETVFAKYSATPSATGTLTLTSSAINETRVITLNDVGMVSY